MEAIQLKDILSYRYLSAVQYSPDGSQAAFVVAQGNEDENNYERRLWLYGKDSALHQLTDIGKEGGFVWEDDTHLLFPAIRSAAEKKRAASGEQFTSYYRLNTNGCGEALHAFTLPFAASSMKKLEGSLWAVVGSINASIPDYYAMSDKEREDTVKAEKEQKDYEVFDEIPFWLNGRGILNKKRNALFLFDASTGHCHRVTAPLFETDDLAVFNGKLYFMGDDTGAHTLRNHFALFELDWSAAAKGNLSDVAVREVRRYEQFYGNGLIAAGSSLYLAATEGKRHGLNENSWFYRLNPENGEVSVLRAEEYSCYSSVGSDCRLGGGAQMMASGDDVYHLTTREGNSFLYRLTPDGEDTPVVTREGSIDLLAVSDHHKKALMVAMYDMKLQELYETDLQTGEVRQISHFNDDALEGKYVAAPVPLEVQSEGLSIGGWVLLPRDYDPEKTYPAVLDIHGGPKTVYGPVFYHEMQLWASMGYFVFFCNPMGSDGRDNVFMDIRGHYGETDYKNICDFTDAVLEKYPQIDKKRVCITGGSYGGFMTNWIIGHTDRFVCAASQRSIANWLSFYGVSDIGIEFGTDQCDADPIVSPEKMWEHSPMKYAGNVKTPTLFIHSDEDYRCPLAEGLQMYTSIAARGVPARLCLFHGENHELSRSGKPLHRIRRLEEITGWFEKYAK